MHEPMIGQIHHFFLSKIELIPFIIANQQHKSMRTSRIDRCEPRYAGTEFTNRECVGTELIQAQQSKYHGCWCTGSLRHQSISTHDIDYV